MSLNALYTGAAEDSTPILTDPVAEGVGITALAGGLIGQGVASLYQRKGIEIGARMQHAVVKAPRVLAKVSLAYNSLSAGQRLVTGESKNQLGDLLLIAGSFAGFTAVSEMVPSKIRLIAAAVGMAVDLVDLAVVGWQYKAGQVSGETILLQIGLTFFFGIDRKMIGALKKTAAEPVKIIPERVALRATNGNTSLSLEADYRRRIAVGSGRGTCDIQVNDPETPFYIFTIRRVEAGSHQWWTITDSTSITTRHSCIPISLNGKLVSEPTVLRPGDRIRWKQFEWEFEWEPGTEPAKKWPVPRERSRTSVGLLYGGAEDKGQGYLVGRDPTTQFLDHGVKSGFNAQTGNFEISSPGREGVPIYNGQIVHIGNDRYVFVELEIDRSRELKTADLYRQIEKQLATGGVEWHLASLPQATLLDRKNMGKLFKPEFGQALHSYAEGDLRRTQGGIFGGESHAFLFVEPSTGEIYRPCCDAPKRNTRQPRWTIQRNPDAGNQYYWHERILGFVQPVDRTGVPETAVVVPLVLERMLGRLVVQEAGLQGLGLSDPALMRMRNLHNLLVKNGAANNMTLYRLAS